MIDILIIGAGGFGREVKCLISDINAANSSPVYNVLGFLDDGIEKGTAVHEHIVLGGLSYLDSLSVKPHLVLAIGAPLIKHQIASQLEGYSFPTLVHPSVSLRGTNVVIGNGCIICEGTILTTDIVVEDFVIINLMCSIGHDTQINKFCSIMPGVNISGEVILNPLVYIGTGAKVINQVQIGEAAVIGAGAVVNATIPEQTTAVGVPARVIKKH